LVSRIVKHSLLTITTVSEICQAQLSIIAWAKVVSSSAGSERA
jgi:hypothetical protein